MAPLKRPRVVEEDEDEEVLSSQSASSTFPQSARKKQRTTETRRQGPFVTAEEDEEYDSEDADAEQRATQAIHKKFNEDEENVPAENGIVESVHCYNFMCHKNWELELNPLINFVVGKNGSGKSAALTALTLCLGGKASATNRATNLKGFIAEGQESATVVVKIKNQGETAYMHDVYGDSIIVERHFTKAGTSGFKLKSEIGRVISTRRADLDDICDYYALQIENPMNILSQDQARQFITASNPYEKYKFFVRGVQLEQMDQDYRVLEDTIDMIESKLRTRQDDIKTLLEDKEKAKRKLEIHERTQNLRDKIHSLRGQMAWAQVEDEEKIRDKFSEELRKQDNFISDAENEAQECDGRFETAEQASQEAAEAARVGHDELQAAEDSKIDVKAEHDRIKNDAADALKDQRDIRQSIKTSDVTIAKLKGDIVEENERLADLHGGSHARRRTEIDEKKAELQELQKEQQDHRQDLERLTELQSSKVKELQTLVTQKDAKQAEVDRGEEHVRNLERNRGDVSKGYHEKLPTLLRAIQGETSFRERPIGPIGHHIRLKEQKWSAVLETSFGGTLNGFVVTSKPDQAILQHLMQRVGCVSAIFISQNEPLDTTVQEPDGQFKTWLRVLEIENEAVKRLVVINHSIEQVILVDDPREASRIMTSYPRNVKHCFYFLRDGRGPAKMMSHNAAGDMRDQPVASNNRTPRMKTDAEQQIRYQRESLQELKRESNEINSSHRECRTAHERAKQAIVRHQREEADFRLKVQRVENEIDGLNATLEQDSVEAGRLDVLRDGLHTAEDQKRVAEASYETSVSELDDINKKLRKSRQALGLKDLEIQGIQSRVNLLDDEAQNAASMRLTELRDKNAAYERINDRKQDKNRIELKHQAQVTKVEDYMRQAGRVSLRVNVPPGETPDGLNKKLERFSNDLEKANKAIGATLDELTEISNRATEKYDTAKRQVEEMESLAQTLKEALIGRRLRWETFRRLICVRAKMQFHYLLSERGFRGRLVTSHERKILDILIEPDETQLNGKGNQATTLSGGEKSFAQICLLLSLWEAMGSPIRALDEFDVYMDAANRAIAMKLLIGAARRSRGRQFIFITPGEGFKAMKNTPDVQFHNLAQPERGQSTLSFAPA